MYMMQSFVKNQRQKVADKEQQQISTNTLYNEVKLQKKNVKMMCIDMICFDLKNIYTKLILTHKLNEIFISVKM